MLGTLLRRVTVRTLDLVVERGRASERPLVRAAAGGLDRLRGVVGLDHIEVRLEVPPWDGSLPDQPMWQSDRDKLHKHRVDRGIVKPPGAAAEAPAAKAEPALKIYFKRGCPYCRAALDLVREREIDATTIDYTDDHDLRRAIRGQTGRKTSPHVFIHGKSIGGFDELRELDVSGKLAELLAGSQPAAAPAPAAAPDEPEDDDTEDEISPTSLQARIAEGAKVLLLDVREPGECRTGVLPDALQIPLGELERRHGELDPAGVWIAYCQAGVRSRQAMELLRGHAFRQVVSLRGGIVAWKEAGGATVPPSQANPPRRVKLPVVHPERSPFEDLLLTDEAASGERLDGDALIARVREVLEEVRPMVQSDGGDIELLDIQDDVVGVRLTGNCIGCPSSQATLRQGIERKLKQRIPQIKGISSPQLAPTG